MYWGHNVFLQASLEFWQNLSEEEKTNFRFLHVSTDEVFGSLSPTEPAFTEVSLYRPNSPYSASKAASDHLVRAYGKTYGLPVLITHCSNNYGPYQYPEKLIPLIIQQALCKQALPIYGDGQQVRDWLYVADHNSALRCVLSKAKPGSVYNIGGNTEKANLEVVETICEHLDHMQPRSDKKSYKEQIQFVKDRLGHDRRYAVDANKIKKELGWSPQTQFQAGLKSTIEWYLNNKKWITSVTDKNHEAWMKKQYGGSAQASQKEAL